MRPVPSPGSSNSSASAGRKLAHAFLYVSRLSRSTAKTKVCRICSQMSQQAVCRMASHQGSTCVKTPFVAHRLVKSQFICYIVVQVLLKTCQSYIFCLCTLGFCLGINNMPVYFNCVKCIFLCKIIKLCINRQLVAPFSSRDVSFFLPHLSSYWMRVNASGVCGVWGERVAGS